MAKTKCFFRFSSDSEKIKFGASRCLFTISVGQQTHENEHFRSTVDLLNTSFKSCIMLVDDTLQRHTMAIEQEKDPDFFYETSITEGDLWLERNEKYYGQLQNLEKIIRWDNWLNHPNFNAQRDSILQLIDSDDAYKTAFQSSVDEFVAKYLARLKNPSSFDTERAKRLSFNFILEECAALCLWQELECAYEVYPNLHNQAINETRARFVLSNRPDLLNTVTLGFRNAAQLAPQKFVCLEQNNQKRKTELNEAIM